MWRFMIVCTIIRNINQQTTITHQLPPLSIIFYNYLVASFLFKFKMLHIEGFLTILS